MGTVATPVPPASRCEEGEAWVLNGTKAWITNAGQKLEAQRGLLFHRAQSHHGSVGKKYWKERGYLVSSDIHCQSEF